MDDTQLLNTLDAITFQVESQRNSKIVTHADLAWAVDCAKRVVKELESRLLKEKEDRPDYCSCGGCNQSR